MSKKVSVVCVGCSQVLTITVCHLFSFLEKPKSATFALRLDLSNVHENIKTLLWQQLCKSDTTVTFLVWYVYGMKSARYWPDWVATDHCCDQDALRPRSFKTSTSEFFFKSSLTPWLTSITSLRMLTNRRTFTKTWTNDHNHIFFSSRRLSVSMQCDGASFLSLWKEQISLCATQGRVNNLYSPSLEGLLASHSASSAVATIDTPWPASLTTYELLAVTADDVMATA